MHRYVILISFLVALVGCAPEAKQSPADISASTESLMDVASPEEIATELGLDPSLQDTSMTPFTLEQQNRQARVNLLEHFPVLILVNKATKGPSAQTITVYHRGEVKYRFPVSTGRERNEKAKSGRTYFSVTPTGWFAPTRTYDKYFSNTWRAWMNYSVFFIGGIALHATTPDHYQELGRRASGGCVRMREEHAKIVYDLILSEGKGTVPVFARNGKISMSLTGRVKTQTSWNTLIMVEDNPNE